MKPSIVMGFQLSSIGWVLPVNTVTPRRNTALMTVRASIRGSGPKSAMEMRMKMNDARHRAASRKSLRRSLDCMGWADIGLEGDKVAIGHMSEHKGFRPLLLCR